MTQESIEIFKDEIYSKPSEKNYSSNKTDIYQNDDIWSLGLLHLKN